MAENAGFYSLKAELGNGKEFNFADLKGKVVLIVNVASKWCVGAFPVLLRRADIFPSADSRRSIRVCRRCTTSTRTRAS